MTMQDTIADLLTRIRNAQDRGKKTVVIPYSRLKESIAKVIEKEGYISAVEVSDGIKKELTVTLKYDRSGAGAIHRIGRISRSSLRVYKGKNDIPKELDGMGIVIISTSKGVMTDREARKLGQGGEPLCYVS